ncbi:MAG TPA: hypothetical protein VKE40_19110, partial [Gemmataceae bacterium]|nr:hypothetical protein [Gemmataceae bacterium]
VFGNAAGVGLGTFTARGTLDGTVIDVTDGDVTSFTAARMRDSTVQVGARYTKGNTVDAAVVFAPTLRKIGTLKLTAPFSGPSSPPATQAASAAFRDSYVAAGSLGTISITGQASIADDTETHGVAYGNAGAHGTVTVGGVMVPDNTTLTNTKFRKAGN